MPSQRSSPSMNPRREHNTHAVPRTLKRDLLTIVPAPTTSTRRTSSGTSGRAGTLATSSEFTIPGCAVTHALGMCGYARSRVASATDADRLGRLPAGDDESSDRAVLDRMVLKRVAHADTAVHESERDVRSRSSMFG
jgi:hypothetical protein